MPITDETYSDVTTTQSAILFQIGWCMDLDLLHRANCLLLHWLYLARLCRARSLSLLAKATLRSEAYLTEQSPHLVTKFTVQIREDVVARRMYASQSLELVSMKRLKKGVYITNALQYPLRLLRRFKDLCSSVSIYQSRARLDPQINQRHKIRNQVSHERASILLLVFGH